MSREVAETLWREASTQVEVKLPNIQTGGKIKLKNRGYAGRIKLPRGHSVVLEPKVEVEHVLRLLRYAEGLESFEFLDRLYAADSIETFYDAVVEELATGIIKQQRTGLHQEYVDKRERSETVRGSIDFRENSKRPWEVELPIRYSLLTPDIEDNRILLWTLFVIQNTGIASEEVKGKVRRAYQSLSRMVHLEPYRASDCLGRNYQRLNRGYERLHVLCHIILSQSGPVRSSGTDQMVPWAVDMETLYEKVVANWLDEHLSEPLSVEPQEKVSIGDSEREFEVDLVFYEGDERIAVADTKYKLPRRPSTSDISQVIAYAEAADVENAFLVYPEELAGPVNTKMGNIHMSTLNFGVADSLNAAGQAFLQVLDF
jgi:5-methylcytosine-specific restriction endonuclease McrBC regulatory subunit McrC